MVELEVEGRRPIVAPPLHAEVQEGLVIGQVGLGDVVLGGAHAARAHVPSRRVVFLAPGQEYVLLAAGDPVDDAHAPPMSLLRSAGDETGNATIGIDSDGNGAVDELRRIHVRNAVHYPVGAAVAKQVAVDCDGRW